MATDGRSDVGDSTGVPANSRPDAALPPADGATPRGAGTASSETPKDNAGKPATINPSTAQVSDTLRGIIQRVGNEPVTSLILGTTVNGVRTTYALHGDQRQVLERVSGMEVVVRGTLTKGVDLQAAPRGAPIFEVRAFEVRAAEGIPAVDGVLQVQGEKYSLLTSAGARVAVPFPPAELRTKVGSRVFLVGALNQAPQAYGVIAPPR